MKILILGSVALPVPPPMQGGTERVAYEQARGLAARGHEVILIAAKGSKADPAYRLVEIGGGDTVAGATNNTNHKEEFVESSRKLRKEAVYLAEVGQWMIDHKDEYDIVLNNMRAGETTFLPIVSTLGKQMLNVMHLPIFSELAELFSRYKAPIITISNAQRKEFPHLNYVATAYNGVDVSLYATGPAARQPQNHPHGDPAFGAPRLASPIAESYLLMMGSIAPHKNQRDGIAVAKATGLPLIMAGKIGNQIYFDREIAPHINGTTIIHKGQMGMDEKIALYHGAKALLFPVLWEEPFGLVMIESMACGTPVIAYGRGAVPEVVVDGKTGFIINTTNTTNITNSKIQKKGIEGLTEAVRRINEIDPKACRAYVEEHFTVEMMVNSYEQALKEVGAK